MIPFLPLFENKTVWGFPYLEINKFGGFTKFMFHVFDRYEICIQAFVYVINGKFIIVHPHLRKIILEVCIHFFTKIRKQIEQIWYIGHTCFEHVHFFSPILT